MIKAAIEKILSLGEIRIFERDGLPYADRELHLVKPPAPAALQIETLTGIVDYLKADIDQVTSRSIKPIALIVHGPKRVDVISCLDGDYLSRKMYLSAVNSDKGVFQFGSFSPLENFIVSLQSGFLDDDFRAAILKVVGNIKTGAEATFDDDGVTQTVTAKAGITRVENVVVPNPVSLRPFRTFPEIDPLTSDFILRIRKGGGVMPEAALFECDGGAWELQTAIKIKEWLVDKLMEASLDIPVIA